ncbi:MAG: histidine--tRNA ligase [Bradymonadales bacterium]|jgi:histidyl-tRNA synthetase
MARSVGIPKGTRDFLPITMRQRAYVMRIIRDVYEAHGFDPIETPAIENIETLTGKYGEEGDQLLFKILKRGAKAATGECDLGLRYDLTVPLSRFVAMHQNEIPRLFKRYQLQSVYRADRPGHGRFREFMQCDIDIVGASAPVAEVGLLAAIFDVFVALKFDSVTLQLNDRRILRALIQVAGIDLELETTAIMAIDKLDKIGEEGVEKELENRGIPKTAAENLLKSLKSAENNEAELQRLETLFAGYEDALEALAELRRILTALEVCRGRHKIDLCPALARGLNYYTGAIFELRAEGLNSSIAGGGRYDKLIGSFAARDIPAVGISLGFERICVIMQEQGLFPDFSASADVMVACFNEESLAQQVSVAKKIRELGLSCELYPQNDKLGKQFKYANERAVSYVAIMGDEELSTQSVTIKNMHNGEQTTISIDALATFFQ